MLDAEPELLPLADLDREFLTRFVRPVLRNWRGTTVGGLRPADALAVPQSS